ncbi:MAG: hypothetical protein R2746_04245 [Acidimicrobiales bacterium]
MTGVRRTFATIVAVALTVALGSCSSDGSDAASAPPKRTTSTTPTSTSATSTTTASVDGGAPVEGPSDEVVLTCDGTTASISTELVATQPDGVHITVHNTSGAEVALDLVDRGDVIAPGRTATVQDIKPRVQGISCGYDQNRTIVGAGFVEIVDPAGNWIGTDIDCTKVPLTEWGGPMGEGSTPEEAVRWWATNRPEDLVAPIAPDDEIAVVGYPDAEAKRYVSRHDGHDTNIFQLTRDGDTWHALPHENCPR